MKGAWQWVAAGLIIFMLFYYFIMPVSSQSGIGADAQVILEDGTVINLTDPFSRLTSAIKVPGSNSPVSMFIIQVYFVPEFTGEVIEWSFVGDVMVDIWLGPGWEVNLLTKRYSDSGMQLQSGAKEQFAKIEINASTIEQKLNDLNVQTGDYALIVKVKYAKLDVKFSTGVTDTFEIAPATPASILTIDFTFEGDTITNVSLGAGNSVTWGLMVAPIEVVTSEV